MAARPQGRGSLEKKRKTPLQGGVALRAAWRFLRNTRGAAALEGAIGAVVLVTASVLAFNLYTQASVPANGLNAAVTVADYVSREEQPAKSQIDDLATFLHREFFSQADMAFVVVVVQGKTAQGATVQSQQWTWTKQILADQNAGPDADLDACSRTIGENSLATTPAALKLEAGEIVIVAEVCVKHADGVAYYHHILPTRSDTVPVLQS